MAKNNESDRWRGTGEVQRDMSGVRCRVYEPLDASLRESQEPILRTDDYLSTYLSRHPLQSMEELLHRSPTFPILSEMERKSKETLKMLEQRREAKDET